MHVFQKINKCINKNELVYFFPYVGKKKKCAKVKIVHNMQFYYLYLYVLTEKSLEQ